MINRSLCLMFVLFVSANAVNSHFLAAIAPKDAAENEERRVKELRKHLGTMAAGLDKMMDGDSTLKNSRAAELMKPFAEELHKALDETKDEKNSTKALIRLNDASAAVHSLTNDLTKRQENLMKEGTEQQTSLLLGVLMSYQDKPMKEQLAVLKAEDFNKLPVAVELLKSNDTKTPLYKQAANYLDKTGAKKQDSKVAKATTKPLSKEAQMAPILTALNARIASSEQSISHMSHQHDVEMDNLNDAIKKSEAKKIKMSSEKIERIKKREDRTYKKHIAVAKNDLESLKTAVEAIKKGDMQTLSKAENALEKSMKAMEAQRGGFLYLIQLGHKTQSLDCPYCAAQCVDKCHTDGNSFTTCLTQCADAGKGK